MEEKIKLTQYSKSAGCAAKLGPKILQEVVGKLPKFQDENLLQFIKDRYESICKEM